MPENENPVLNEDRASRVSFGDWTHDDLTLSTFRTQFLIDACRVRPEIAAVLGTAVFGESSHG
jgi:hypothetical protein